MNSEFVDIKPIIVAGDYSFYLFIVTLIGAFYLAYLLFKKFYKIAKKSCKKDCYKYYLSVYSSVDWSNPKEAAYIATKYGEALALDKRRREIFEQLKRHLEKYKYKKSNNIGVDSQTLNYYNLYKQVCDESI